MSLKDAIESTSAWMYTLEEFDISVDNVIRGIQKGNEERAIFTCEGYKCIWKRK